MANVKKDVQKKADEKRKGKRARAWTAIVWEDSAKEGWREALENLLVECLISPKHDKDVKDDGSPIKPHWHIVLSFKNPTTYEKAKELFEEVGANVPPEKECKVKDFKQMARYLCHMDQPQKHQYEITEVISIGAIDYANLVMSGTDEDEMLDLIFEFMDDQCIETYPQMVRAVKQYHPEWKSLVYRKFSHQITNYAKGIHAELKGL